MLDKEFKYYIDNQDTLVKKYYDQYIVIKGEEVVGTYDSEIDAYEQSIKIHELGKFLIQHCLPGEESYSTTYHSRVVLN